MAATATRISHVRSLIGRFIPDNWEKKRDSGRSAGLASTQIHSPLHDELYMTTPPPPRSTPREPNATPAHPHTPGGASHGQRADDAPAFRYTAKLADEIESRWQRVWDERHTFRALNPGEAGFDPRKPKFYCLDMFPYPSGAGLHVGHPEGYTATDIVCRFMRMTGHNVLHPMGWDAFGLPAEQYAIQTGVHPAITTKKSMETFRRQLKRFGFSYDWSREIATIDPEYYRWTQWVFLQCYESWFDPKAQSPMYPDGSRRIGCARPISELIARLESRDLWIANDGSIDKKQSLAPLGDASPRAMASRQWSDLSKHERRTLIDDQRLVYLDEMIVNWCPALGTVLANDEVIDGRSERGGHPVLRKPLRQWQFRITTYAQRLLDDLGIVNWPESTRTQQREWIGKSEGAEITFEVVGTPAASLTVFTTRPDTIFGATYMVVAPEHALVQDAIDHPQPGADAKALRDYVLASRNKADVDRMADAKDKTGVFTGLYAINPATNEKIPIWTADYVLTGYGTGAIMAVPAHDERDLAFAKKFGLPIVDVVDSRVTAIVRWYGAHVRGDELTDPRWNETLADFLGLAISSNAVPHYLSEAFEAVRTRRGSPAEARVPAITLSGTGRGAIQAEWLDTIKVMRLTSPAQIVDLVQRRALHAHLDAAFTGDGYAVNSKNTSVDLNGLALSEAKARAIAWMERPVNGRAVGRTRINFKLRDWVFSRQRYWGEPFPIVYDEAGRHYPISDAHLPVVLPELEDYSPVESDTPQPLLAKATTWVKTTAGKAGVSSELLSPDTLVTRETNTMPGSAGSSWYFLRYCDPKNSERLLSREADQYWMGGGAGARRAGVDLYIGGSEHAVGHLLYSRFWQKVLFDLGHVATPEPFDRLFHQGMITSFAYQRPDKTLVASDLVDEVGEGHFVERGTGTKLAPIVAKMSKSLKNVINPDDIIHEFGADTFRLYEMYMGPLDASKPWNTKDTIGCFRFLQRAWRVCVDEQTGALRTLATRNNDVERLLHRTIAKLSQDIPRLAFNTAIASMMELVNLATSAGGMTKDQIERFALALAPFAPHLGEELWSKCGHTQSLAYEPFPTPDPAMLVDDAIEIPISINGKPKGRISVTVGLDKAELESAAMASEVVQGLIAGKSVTKVVVVPGKMVNFVIAGG